MKEPALKLNPQHDTVSPAFLIAMAIQAAQNGRGSLQSTWAVWNVWGSAENLTSICEANNIPWAIGLDGFWIGPPRLVSAEVLIDERRRRQYPKGPRG